MIEYSHIFKEGKKQKYGIVSNLLYNMRCAWEYDRKLFWYQLLPIVPSVSAAYLGTLLPAWVVRGLEEGRGMEYLVGGIFAIALTMWCLNLAAESMTQYRYRNSALLRNYYAKRCFQKIMDMDYDVTEAPENQKVIGNTWRSLRNPYNFVSAANDAPVMLEAAAAVILYGILLGRQSLLLLLLQAASVGISLWLLGVARRKHTSQQGELSRYARETAYISRQSMESSSGKDIRIYRLADWILQKYEDSLTHMDGIFRGIHNWYFLKSFSDCVVRFLVNGFVWGYLLLKLVEGELAAAEFVWYMGLVNGFSSYFETMIRMLMTLSPRCVAISYIREMLDMENQWGKEKQQKEKQQKEKQEEQKKKQDERQEETQAETQAERGAQLELRDVSYRYPGKKEPVLSHINLTIAPGEKLALLGLNGAGKTTLVKLICGFYQPTEGEILLNGIPVRDYDREEYYSLISVLFQDFTLLPLSVDENITGRDAGEARSCDLEQSLKLSGFYEKYERLPKKGESLLIKEVNEQAVDFSGGEKQKLLFARALYKRAPFLILDEPTAALDPIAENEMYLKFNEAARGRTALYISHRLSSTRFCDRIVLLEHGRIVEEGTHESLLSGDTRYARLYQVQSRYYKEQEKRKERSRIMGDEYVAQEGGEEGIFYESARL